MEEPLVLIDRECRIAFQNPGAEKILRSNAGVSSRDGRLVFTAPLYNEWLGNALARLSRKLPSDATGCAGIRIARERSRREWIVIVTALTPAAHEGGRCFAVQFIGRLYPRAAPRSLLAEVFALSRREIQVLALLIRRQGLRQIASSLCLSHEAIRSNLKQIFRKCQVRSQTELIALIQRIAFMTSKQVSRPAPPSPGRMKGGLAGVGKHSG